jgi:hypothetical protein
MIIKIQLASIAFCLFFSHAMAQSSGSFVSIPANQYGQSGKFGSGSDCDTVGTGRTKDLTATKLAFFLQQSPDTFSLFVVENVHQYPTSHSIFDTLNFSKTSSTQYSYTTHNVGSGTISSVVTAPSTYKLIYMLPTFSSYVQWKNSFVQVHFKVKGDNLLYTIKDTTLRTRIVLPINLTVHGLLLSSGNSINYVSWRLPFIDTSYQNKAIVPLLGDGTYYADENSFFSDYVTIGDGRKTVSCSTEKSLTYKAINDSIGNGLLRVPFQNGAAYQWFYQGDTILNATSNTYQATASGTYSVTATFDFINAAAHFRTEGNNLVTGTYSYNYTATVTDLETGSLAPSAKTVVKIYNALGEAIQPEEALHGMFIYQYNDGSTRKVMKMGQ